VIELEKFQNHYLQRYFNCTFLRNKLINRKTPLNLDFPAKMSYKELYFFEITPLNISDSNAARSLRLF